MSKLVFYDRKLANARNKALIDEQLGISQIQFNLFFVI